MSGSPLLIEPAVTSAELELARCLFYEYIGGLGVDLSFQNVEAELENLPGQYAPPAGVILLATRAGAPLGCGALRPLSADICEMKRLYVRPEARGEKLGLRLAEALIGHARAAGYARMRLDTLASMHSAHRLYAFLGFKAITPYTANPLPGTQFMERVL